MKPCPICDDTFVVVVAGPDENGMYDTDDCECQIAPRLDQFAKDDDGA